MNSLEIGDRVAVYDETRFGREVGLVEFIGGEVVSVNVPNYGPIAVHYKQCRRLTPKPRKRIWVLWNGVNYQFAPVVYEECPAENANYEVREFIEVKRCS